MEKDDESVASSAVEFDGMDMNEEVAAVEEEEEEETILPDDTNNNTEDDLANQDDLEMEETRKERMELMAAETKSTVLPDDAQGRFEYLMQQSEVFAHFLAGSVAATEAKKSKKGSRGRLTEAEEDALLLKSAASKRRVIRLDHQPSNLADHCKMHPYQLEGLNWLIKLHDHGISGILADEMGLGKTLQTISMLAYLREGRGVKGPHLVIVPKSVVGNWMREFKKWCPVIRTIRMGGTKEERQRFLANGFAPDANGKHTVPKFDALVTSYEGLLKEKGRLSKVAWQYVIIDEAHRIKNEQSSLSIAVRNMKTQFRLLITGTPLQNNLRELWALLNFIMPDIFGDADMFDQWFSLADDSGKENVIKKLHTVLRPFMLRRVKKDVATALPPKKETRLYIGLTEMQREWYIKCLRKEAHELNKLGGPDKNRLLNVLMQLRKCCNHPYLFDGAEEGPPYCDGPHLWENSGKMQLLHKLLPKLKANDSRVLIFSQMTRVLDILEDYFRLVNYDYCRIDGNTDGEKRDSQMDEFNRVGSPKFAFLLSTRAGGLGINLATADIVILYDSDWNPQVDLQAMDRAHRIGQTKPVQVFRFITEGTVEEKIIERADRKLFLDAAVIQQGRLAEQHSSLEKNELMKMVQFGADQILSGTGGQYTDEDIDALIAKGQERTDAMQAKLQKDAKHNLANFSLLSEDESGRDTFAFDGKNYRDADKNPGNFINLPQRQRKRVYDLAASSQGNSAAMKGHAADATAKKKRKGPALHDFQLFDMERMNSILTKERELATKKANRIAAINDMRQRGVEAPPRSAGVAQGHGREDYLEEAARQEATLDDIKLTPQEEEEKKKLFAEGFPDWSRKDFKAFCSGLEKYGRYDFPNVCNEVISETGKTRQEIQRYFVAFWTHYQRIKEWPKILEKVERGEKKILRLRQIRDAIQEKVERHLEDTFGPHYGQNAKTLEGKPLPSLSEMLHYSWPLMKINYGSSGRGKGYREDEDAFLVCMMYRHGFGAAERIRMEIRRAWQFRFDWYFKSRPAADIQRRCEAIVKVIERENEELRKKEEGGPKEPLIELPEPTPSTPLAS
ncbi:SWI/SNF-related matrix-associated actin-dependent regulator of chromatin subfamily A member 5 [Fistulifera solaris]|uniref:SWI/SNF-related matrix-associated actin-dependent regulator of chromatin subfamily A member 5 n=1 Tax=Fistulifera solaris TaxID=1519565 RepID=A0A1Z5KQX7_FISSO|nr:SWI/SNF-related matrix-associated actin-dependent regulator of chromatin subfamily A member 5 [Fistulifera solaris]|eukprot:GAX28328.1 SWI/SNF-related matrix-associated actin-dependent regulator of chromatin subfamily A member 5 [Fistulifera solaris]